MNAKGHSLHDDAWRKLLHRRAILSGGLWATLFSHVANSAAATAGLVQEVRGQVTAELASQRRLLVPHADVYDGDDVATGDNARAEMKLGRDTTLRLGADAKVRIDRLIVNAGGVLTLEAGPMLLDKAPGHPASALKVRGWFGLITIRGTRIFVGPSQGGHRHFRCARCD